MPPKKAAKKEKETADRSIRRTVTGVVTGDKMEKTIKVRVDRLVKHPMFEKTLRASYVCYAHDEKREARSGDKVELMETRPMSRLKHWRLMKILEKGARGADDVRAAARPAGKPGEPAGAPKA